MGKCIPCDKLTLAHFRKHPIWLASHIHDFGNPRYENEDEDAMRPWDGKYPAPRNFSGDVLAQCETSSGLKMSGLLTVWDLPEDGKDPIIKYGPRVWLPNGKLVSFWHGAVHEFGDKHLSEDKENFYEGLSLNYETAFPLQFTIGPEILQEPIVIKISGFGYFNFRGTAVEYDA